MSEVIVRVIGAASEVETPHDGRYVVTWNPHTEAGTLEVTSTEVRELATRFASAAEVLKYAATVSEKEPVRPWDGKPNRPLMALTFLLEPA